MGGGSTGSQHDVRRGKRAGIFTYLGMYIGFMRILGEAWADRA